MEPKGERPGCNDHDMLLHGGGCHVSSSLKNWRRVTELFILDLSPSLKTLCKLAVVQYGLQQSQLPHNIRWELTAMTANIIMY